MADLVAEALLSSLFQTLFDKLASRALRSFFRGLKVNQALLRKLKIMLLSANQVVDDAEVKQLTNPNVRKWLFELKDTIYETEDVLDEINYRALQYERRNKPRSKPLSKRFQSFLNCFRTFDEAIERQIEEILDRLKFIVEQKDVLGLNQGVTNKLPQRLPAPLADESFVYGRNDDKEKIIKLLLSDNGGGGGSSSDKISVIPIVGMGGIGKTTLAQLVYEDERVKSRFHIRSWVVVSDESDVSVIARRIHEEITSKKCETEGLYQLQCKLREALRDKRFLFVLDDVWNENYEQWDALMSSFQSGAHGSKIIVTTRSDTVAKKMGNVATHHLGTISDDECWKLFADHVFQNVRSEIAFQELHAIGRDIVKKCKGVPLAIKSLAGLLRSVSDTEEWKRILNSEIWESQLQGSHSNNILPSLWLSYHYLPSHLKRCFAYCSIFPKDYIMTEFIKESIILLWMAEGLLQPENTGERIEDVGNRYFQELISRSLFQPLRKDESTILMHDLMHDLAVFVSGEFSFRLDDNVNAKFSCKTRHLSYSKIDDFEKYEGLSEAKSIRSCLRISSSYGKLSSGLPQLKTLLLIGRCLRALCLSGCGFTVLPDSIGNLKQLRYLDLTGNGDIEEIPNTLCCLYNLQTLRLSRCDKLTQLPTDMGNLVNLRHLDVEGVPLEKMPPKICNLKDLQTLSDFVVGKNGGPSIEALGELHFLSGELKISKLQNVDVVENVVEFYLKDKKYLGKLECCWSISDRNDDSRKDKEVLGVLQPHPNLKELVIDGYGVETFPGWLGHCSYNKMVIVCLRDCYSCRVLPSLGQLPSLEELYIRSFHGVERVGAEFYSDGSFSDIKPFESLKWLEFKDMSEWQEWSFPISREDGGCFPSLEHLRIWNCPKVNVCLPDIFPSLKTLDIRRSEQIAILPGIQQMQKFFPRLDLLKIENCPKLETFVFNNFPSNLREAYLSGNGGFLSPGSRNPTSRLVIEGCQNVVTFPEALYPTTLTCLLVDGLLNLKALNEEGFQHFPCLEELRIAGCKRLECLPGEGLPASLTSLQLTWLPKLEDLSKGLQHLISLKELRIDRCLKLRCLSENGLPTSLTSLTISGLSSLEELGKSFFQHLLSLEQLHISSCKNLKYSSLEEENGRKNGLKNFISLKKLLISASEKLMGLLEEGLPTSLTSFHISRFSSLRDLNQMGFQHLKSLENLEIRHCENLQCLPEAGLPSSLSYFCINGCPLLEPRCRRGSGSDWHKISHIPHVKIEPSLPESP